MELQRWISRTLRTAAWAPIVVVVAYGMALAMLGPVPPSWLDNIAHFAGGLAMSYFGLAAMNHLQSSIGKTPMTARLIAAVGFAAVAAIVWELVEFLVDFTARTRLAPSIDDTLLDLALGLAGAVGFALAVVVNRRTNGGEA
jgi:uncharacterized membrane-anchored protein